MPDRSLSWFVSHVERLQTLQPAELEALKGAAMGETIKETARRLQKSKHTIESQRRNAMRKLGARTVAQAVALAIAKGLIEAE